MKVICCGDSNTYGYDPRSYIGGRYPVESRWVDLLREKTGWQIENQGENGRMIPRFPLTVPEDTGLLVVMLGTNDLLQYGSPVQAAERMEKFLAGIALARQRILLIAPPPLQLGEWVPSGLLVEASQELAARYRSVTARLGARFADAGEWKVSLSYDGVHFTAQGHRTFAQGLYDQLEKEKLLCWKQE